MAIVEPDHYMDGDTPRTLLLPTSEIELLVVVDLHSRHASPVYARAESVKRYLNTLWPLIVSNSSEAVTLRENFVWHIFPNMNPDGYYTTFNEMQRTTNEMCMLIIYIACKNNLYFPFTKDRRWRKNKRPYHHNELCFGVDLNRNWNWNFGGCCKAAYDTCAHIKKARWEEQACDVIISMAVITFTKETVSLKEQLLSMRDEIIFVLDVHAHAQLILHPDDANDHVIFVAKKISEAMTSVSGNKFVSGTSQDLLNYPPNGTFFHWAHSVIGIEHSYAIEVQPRLTDWFIGDLAPDGLITKSGQELLVGIYAALESQLVLHISDHSNDPCSSIYEGPHAFSEQETVSLKEQLLSMRDEIIFVLDVHAHAQMILHPDDANDHVIFVAKKISEAMTSVSGNKFVSGTSQDLLNYPPNGTFFHWAHSVIGIEHSYAIEVQPRLTDWFIGDLAPDGLITKSGQELLVGIYAALESILAKI
ncbi:hypothetical protein CAPTEDRAFT_205943 [Capitella teleta]|uniref:Peptidase M14 domain-containing protein n=1 Tax=Capitella teleta TaxID=283909 RepID=R7TYJ2_CAPTE|nr:hypothetical protein CAPTEDRAFT_205943 [Capitella teleta]|eukprot:ELT98978.1 hypothetical protein CAPTEDRAFT_205943 [Capitella teleta]